MGENTMTRDEMLERSDLAYGFATMARGKRRRAAANGG